MPRRVSSQSRLPAGHLRTHAFLLLPEFGRERGTEVRRLENLANLDLGLRPGGIRAALDPLQWPAIIVKVVAAWLIASQAKRKREIGFWFFLFSNARWIVWSWQDHAYALISLQIALALLNIRGASKNDPDSGAKSEA